LLKIATNITINKQLFRLFAWAMKFNRKYVIVGPRGAYTTPNRMESASCRVFLRGGWTPWIKQVTHFSRSAPVAQPGSVGWGTTLSFLSSLSIPSLPSLLSPSPYPFALFVLSSPSRLSCSLLP